jgi:hypothetical protein
VLLDQVVVQDGLLAVEEVLLDHILPQLEHLLLVLVAVPVDLMLVAVMVV